MDMTEGTVEHDTEIVQIVVSAVRHTCELEEDARVDLDVPIFGGGLGIDSVRMLELLSIIEEKVGMELDEIDFNIGPDFTVRDMVELAARLRDVAGGQSV